jgi:hypothetical protein
MPETVCLIGFNHFGPSEEKDGSEYENGVG